LPHSEICGSKVAHTSPQLIAACHVLHRLCMPRHPPNALTSRLKIHTTNDSTARLKCSLFVSRASASITRSHMAYSSGELHDTRLRHRFQKTHSQCQRRSTARAPATGIAAPARVQQTVCLILEADLAQRRGGRIWWSLSGSNR
jgi:hypothetical protein